MGNRQNRQSRRLGASSPERQSSDTQVETHNVGNATLSNSNDNVQESLRESNLENQLTDTSQNSNEIQVGTQIFEQKNIVRVVKIREVMDSKFKAIPKETNIRASKIKILV